MIRLALLVLILSAIAGAAAADPCMAVPDRGPTPAWLKRGAVFSGQVRFVVDGDGLCVGRSADPASWVEVRLSDFYAPELGEPGGAIAKARLQRLVGRRDLVCVAGRRSWDRIVATCSLGDVPLGRRLLDAGGVQGGKGWRGN